MNTTHTTPEMRDAFEAWYATTAFDYAKNPIGSRECGLQWAAWQAAQSQPAPPVPASVQEIMRLMAPYIRACVKFNNAKMGDIDTTAINAVAAFKPLETALTAIVAENHRLKFELDGVRAMRGPLTDEEIIKAANIGAVYTERVGRVERHPEQYRQELQRSFLRGARWALTKAPPTHGIEPEQGEVKS